MSQTDFETALITAAFRLAGEDGWPSVTVAAAARAAGLSLAEARERFPGRAALLMRFGRMMDRMALADAPAEGPVRERLFDLLMRRYDALQPHRAGVISLLRALPLDPPLALMLHTATQRSMRWMLQAAGVTATGVRGGLQVHGLTAVWYWVLRTWERDESEDLSATMAALDSALQSADQMASWMHGGRAESPPPADGDATAVVAAADVQSAAAADIAPLPPEAGGASSRPDDDTPIADMPLPGPTV